MVYDLCRVLKWLFFWGGVGVTAFRKRIQHAPMWVERGAFSFFFFWISFVWDRIKQPPVTAEKAVTENGLTDDSTSYLLRMEHPA